MSAIQVRVSGQLLARQNIVYQCPGSSTTGPTRKAATTTASLTCPLTCISPLSAFSGRILYLVLPHLHRPHGWLNKGGRTLGYRQTIVAQTVDFICKTRARYRLYFVLVLLRKLPFCRKWRPPKSFIVFAENLMTVQSL